MKTLTLHISDDYFDKIVSLLEMLPKKAVKIKQEDKKECVARPIPKNHLASSVHEVRQRVLASEQSVDVDEQCYQKEMKHFLHHQLKIKP
jgi:hypothetical protein